MIYFDLDNTLIDYNSSERKAIEFIFKEKYGLVLNNNQTDYWSKISRKYFDYYLSKQITFEEQGKNRFIKMLSYCGYVENEKIAMELFEEYQKQLENSWILFDDVVDMLHSLEGYRLGMSLLFCVILFYMIFLPLYFPLSEFVNTGGTI